MTKQYRFAHTDSVYTHQPDDPRAVVLQTDGLQPDADPDCPVLDHALKFAS